MSCWMEATQTEEEVGRQHQGMDRRRVHQVPEGSGEQGKMEETGCEIIFGEGIDDDEHNRHCHSKQCHSTSECEQLLC